MTMSVKTGAITLILIMLLLGHASAAQDTLESVCNLPLTLNPEYNFERRAWATHDGLAFGITAIDLDPTGTQILVAEEEGLLIFSAETLERLIEISLYTLVWEAVDWSPDGTRFSTYSRSFSGGGGLQIWDTDTLVGQYVVLVEHASGRNPTAYTTAWSPDGEHIAVVGPEVARVWRSNSTEVTLDRPGDNFYRAASAYSSRSTSLAAWSPDGQWLALPRYGEVTIYDTTTWEPAHTLQTAATDGITGLAWSSQDRLAVIGFGEDTYILQVWNTETWEVSFAHEQSSSPSLRSLAWSPDGEILAVGSDWIDLWDIEEQTILRTLADHAGFVYDIEWLPDGEHLISRAITSAIYRWDVETGCVEASLLIPPIEEEE